LVDDHPYIDTSEVEVKFEDMDPEEKSAKGVIILQNKAGAPFSIGKSEDTQKIELDPIDIIYMPGSSGGGQFCHLNESSYRRAIQEADVGRPFPEGESEGDEYAKLPPGNEYIGDMTGDVTPLEYSGYPNAISSGGALRSASSGLLSRVVRTDQDLQKLHKLLTDHRGLNIAAESVGLKQSLDELPTEGEDNPTEEAQFVQIRRKDNGRVVVEYSNGHQTPISGADLQEALGSDYESVMREVMGGKGWAIVRDFPTIQTPEVPTINTYPGPIDQGGWCKLVDESGDKKRGLVCPQMLDFDGQTINKQKVLLENDTWDEGATFCGHPISEPPLSDHPAAGGRL
ncbi:MAG: hypothetical protein ABEN55_10875, partial [Bradymonadaceae bacterium]